MHNPQKRLYFISSFWFLPWSKHGEYKYNCKLFPSQVVSISYSCCIIIFPSHHYNGTCISVSTPSAHSRYTWNARPLWELHTLKHLVNLSWKAEQRHFCNTFHLCQFMSGFLTQGVDPKTDEAVYHEEKLINHIRVVDSDLVWIQKPLTRLWF